MFPKLSESYQSQIYEINTIKLEAAAFFSQNINAIKSKLLQRLYRLRIVDCRETRTNGKCMRMCEKDRGDIENLSRCEETNLWSALVSEGGIKARPWIHLPEFLWFSLPAILWYHLKNMICRVLKALCTIVSFPFFLLTLITCCNMFFSRLFSSSFEKIQVPLRTGAETCWGSPTARIFDNFEL